MDKDPQLPRRPRILCSTDELGSSGRRDRVIPLSFQVFGVLLNLLSLIRVDWSAAVLQRLFFTVFKTEPRPWVAGFWQSADEHRDLAVDDTHIPVYRWGDGPAVVFMHGWSGSGTQFRHFIEPLVVAGFRVICFDAPGHGANPGRQSHLLRFSGSLEAIRQAFGSIDCVLAHSFGAMAACYAIRQGLDARRLVLIAPQLDINGIFETYTELLHMRPELADRFRARTGERIRRLGIDDPWSEFEVLRLLGDLATPGLLVYDDEDPEIPTESFERFAELWCGSSVHRTRGLGHNRILKDAGVIAAVVEYLRA